MWSVRCESLFSSVPGEGKVWCEGVWSVEGVRGVRSVRM